MIRSGVGCGLIKNPEGVGRPGRPRRGRLGALLLATAAVALWLAQTVLAAGPPVLVRSEIAKPKNAPYKLGDFIHIATLWRSSGAPLDSVKADLHRIILDPSQHVPRRLEYMQPDSVFVDSLIIQLPFALFEVPKDTVGLLRPIPITAWNSFGASVPDTTIHIFMDTTPPDSLLMNPLPRVTAKDSVDVSGSVKDASAVFVVHNFIQSQAAFDTLTGLWHFRVGLKTGTNTIQAWAEDAAGNATGYEPNPATLVTQVSSTSKAPVLLGWTFVDTLAGGVPVPLHDQLGSIPASTIRFYTEWAVPDSNALSNQIDLRADLSRFYGGHMPWHPTQIVRDPSRNGFYLLTHTLPDSAHLADTTHIAIPLTATSPTGDFTNDNSIFVCLSNTPPVHLKSVVGTVNAKGQVVPRPHPYRTGDSLWIETVWHVAPDLSLSVRPDFSSIESDSTKWAAHPRVLPVDGDSSIIVFVHRLPFTSDQIHQGQKLPIPLIGYDTGCGETYNETLLVDVDDTPPDTLGLRLNPLPAVTDQDTIHISGTAPDTSIVGVQILRDRVFEDSVAVPNPVTRRFDKRFPLLLGANPIQIRGEDASGNVTPLVPSNPTTVTRTTRAGMSVPAPFSRYDDPTTTTDDIVFLDPQGFASVSIRIFNLQGDCVNQAEDPNPGSQFTYHWPGTDRFGHRAPQGYYLVRAVWKDVQGHSRNETHGLLLKD